MQDKIAELGIRELIDDNESPNTSKRDYGDAAANEPNASESDIEVLETNKDTDSKEENIMSKKVAAEFESLDEIFSDADFEDDKFVIGRHIIRNFTTAKHSISEGIDIPQDLKLGKFNPTPVALNNKIVFISIGSGTGTHIKEKKPCGLYPTCRIFWTNGARISKVRILHDVPGASRNEVWACEHHNLASVKGYTLQTQAVMYDNEEKNVKTTEGNK